MNNITSRVPNVFPGNVVAIVTYCIDLPEPGI